MTEYCPDCFSELLEADVSQTCPQCGCHLAAAMASTGAFGDAAATMPTIVADVARALDFAHTCGVIHRDIKPANILLDKQSVPRLADFGLAKRRDTDSGMTLQWQILGTPAYMPPEQASGDHDQVGPLSD